MITTFSISFRLRKLLDCAKQVTKRMDQEKDYPEHVRRNRAAWNKFSLDYAEPGRRAWREEPHWGIWHIPEKDVHLLPDVSGRDVIELGCGTAYVSAWLARRGARVTGIDISGEQLKTARSLQAEHALEFPLIHGSAEQVTLPDASFDLAISEYGASIWCDCVPVDSGGVSPPASRRPTHLPGQRNYSRTLHARGREQTNNSRTPQDLLRHASLRVV